MLHSVLLTCCVYGHRPSVEVHQQQAAQPFVYVPTTLRYDDRPPAAAIDHSSEWRMSDTPNPPSVTAAPGNKQYQHLQSWETGRVMPAQSTMSSPFTESETVPSTFVPHQTYVMEQRSANLPPYVAVSPEADWSQYGATYDAARRQAANSDMPKYTVMPTEYHPEYSRQLNVNVGGNMADDDQATLEVSPTSAVRGASSSALRQPASAPGSGKKTVTFHENIATEYSIHQSYGSTSSDSSFIALSPPDMSAGYDSVRYPSPANSYSSPVPR